MGPKHRAQTTEGPEKHSKGRKDKNDRSGITKKKKQTRHKEGKRGSSTGATRNGEPELQKSTAALHQENRRGAETRGHAKRQDTTRAKLVLVAGRELTRE